MRLPSFAVTLNHCNSIPLPVNVEFIPGQMIVSFRTIEDLAQAMYSLARAIETDERLAFRDLSATKQLSSPYSGI